MKIKNIKYLLWGVTAFVLLILSVCVSRLYSRCNSLNEELENSRKIYVYNLDRVIEASNILMMKQDFEAEILKLNEEVNQAQKKIKSIKDAKIKTEFSDVYLNSLKLKRDNLVEEYGKEMQKMSDFINKALVDIAEKYSATTIYNDKLIAVRSPYIIDVTDEIVNIIKSSEDEKTAEDDKSAEDKKAD